MEMVGYTVNGGREGVSEAKQKNYDFCLMDKIGFFYRLAAQK